MCVYAASPTDFDVSGASASQGFVNARRETLIIM